MMKNTLLLAVALCVQASLSAQITLDNLDRIERPWPPEIATGDKGLACGAFLAGHPGRFAVALRGNGSLAAAWQPAEFEHAVLVGAFGGTDIGSMPAVAGGADALAHVSAAGLVVLRYDQDVGFVPATAQAPLASWGTIRKLEVYTSWQAPVGNFVVGWNTGFVRVAFVDADDQMLPLWSTGVPAGSFVLDATMIDWDGDNYPEIAVLTTTGLFVMNYLNQFLVSDLEVTNSGRIVALQVGGQPAVARVRRVGGSSGPFHVRSCIRTGPNEVRTVNGGALTLPGSIVPTGLCATDLWGDAEPEVIVSCDDSVRRILQGSVNGPTTALTTVNLWDVRVETIPPNPQLNQVQLVLDDIDRNGTTDLVIPQTATNQLVIIRSVLPQIQEQGFGNTNATGGEVESVVLDNVLGYVGEPEGWEFEKEPSVIELVGNFDGLAMRLEMPDWAAGEVRLQVLVYEIEKQGTTASGNDPVVTTALGHYHFDLPEPWVAGGQVNIIVPVPDTATMSSNQLGRFLIEVNVMQMAGEQVVATSAALFASELMVPEDPAPSLVQELVTLLFPVVAEYPYLDASVNFVVATWNAGTAAAMAIAPWSQAIGITSGMGNFGLPGRYIGFVPPVGPAPKFKSDLPKIPAVVNIGNARKVQ